MICKICDNEGDFEHIDGRYYCTVCNNQYHGEYDMEFSDEETNHKGQKQLERPSGAFKSKSSLKLEADDDDHGK
jgi:uncharacterized Zn finger protein (UPF0148 family)